MKQFILLALVVLATVYAEDEDKPQRRRPAVFVKRIQRAKQNETYSFNFALAHVEELNEQNVTLYKIVKGEKGPDFEESKFNVSLKTLDEEGFKQWWEENKKGKNDTVKPFPNKEFKSAVVGDVSIASVSCEDQGPYLVYYDIGVHKNGPKRLPHRGVFFLKVEGCPGPHPEPRRGPAIFVRNYHKANQNETYEFKFGVAGKKPLKESEVHLWKIVRGDRGRPELKPTDFDISLKTLSEEEIKQWEEEKKAGRHFPHVILGKVSISSVSCDNQGPYLIKYGSHHHDDKEHPHPRPHPHPHPRGLFFIRVRGCGRPREEDQEFKWEE